MKSFRFWWMLLICQSCCHWVITFILITYLMSGWIYDCFLSFHDVCAWRRKIDGSFQVSHDYVIWLVLCLALLVSFYWNLNLWRLPSNFLLDDLMSTDLISFDNVMSIDVKTIFWRQNPYISKIVAEADREDGANIGNKDEGDSSLGMVSTNFTSKL